MKKKILHAMFIGCCVCFISCTKKSTNSSNAEKEAASYAVGQQLGETLRNQGYEYDADVIAESIKSALKGKPSKLTEQEMQEALTGLQQDIMKKEIDVANDNKVEATTFLEKNKSLSNVHTTPSGLQYVIQKSGKGKIPKDTDIVKVHYKGSLISGKPFDASYKDGKTEQLPVSAVIKGWREALLMMKEGDQLKLFLPPDLAYGSSVRPGIPANSVLVFDFELQNIVTSKK